MVSTINSQEKLDELEKEMMKEYDDYEAYIKDVRYQLPESTVFEGKTFTRAKVTRLKTSRAKKMFRLFAILDSVI